MQCDDESYFELLETGCGENRTAVVLVGEEDEQWTEQAQNELKRANVPFSFFSWSKLKDARQSGEWIRYPVLQFWKQGRLVNEITGFSQHQYRRFVTFYLNL